MKVLIWVVCFFCMVMVQVIIKNAGITLGGLPTAILFSTTYWIASSLSRTWETKHSTQSKEPAEEEMVPEEDEEIKGDAIPLSVIMPILLAIFVVILAIVLILERS